jgi:hypothetical protein
VQEDLFFGRAFNIFGDLSPSVLRRIFFSIDMGCLNVVFYSKMESISLGLVFKKRFSPTPILIQPPGVGANSAWTIATGAILGMVLQSSGNNHHPANLNKSAVLMRSCLVALPVSISLR